MRSPTWGLYKGVSEEFSKEETLEMFRKMCVSRSFELKLKEVFDAKRMRPLYIYPSLGQESISSAIATVFTEVEAVFPQHRCHDIYLAFGGNPVKLIDELLGLPTGCAGGMGGSASIHEPEGRPVIVGHDGHMGTQVYDATGSALGDGKKTLAFMGDASAEEGYVLGAEGYGATRKLPVLYVCVDNGLSILTPVSTRRSWKMQEVVLAFGMHSFEITDDPWLIMHHVKILKDELPAFLNIHTCRTLWHNGTGNDGPPEWDRFSLVKKEIERLGFLKDAEIIEGESKEHIEKLWEERLRENPYTPEIKIPPRPRTGEPTVAETISRITEEHLKQHNGLAAGECLTAVGWVGGTVPKLTEAEGLVETSMDDTSWTGIMVGAARVGRRPIAIVRYQGFQSINASPIVNLAAKSKDMWGVPRPILVRSIGMDSAIGPVASGSHHSLFTRMPGIYVYAPMTPKEYEYAYEFFMAHDDPMYLSEHRSAFQIDYEMEDIIHEDAHITLLPISSTRLNAIEAAEDLEKEGIVCNLIHLKWLKPFEMTVVMKQSIKDSVLGGLVIDGDFGNGHMKSIACDLMLETGKKVDVLGLDERAAGFAPQCDNLPPTKEKIIKKVKAVFSEK